MQNHVNYCRYHVSNLMLTFFVPYISILDFFSDKAIYLPLL